MKFKLVPEYRYPWPVEVKIPDPEKGGSYQTQKLTLFYKSLPFDQAQKRAKEVTQAAAKSEDDGVIAEIEFLVNVIDGWAEVEGDDGQDVPFTIEGLRHAIQFPWFRAGAYRGFFESVAGREPSLGN